MLHPGGTSILVKRVQQLWPDIGIGISVVTKSSPEIGSAPGHTVPSAHFSPEVCNVTAPVEAAAPLRSWKLPPGWERVCEVKNNVDHVDIDRNWCWVGVKKACHDHLKNHMSWERLQNMAASFGSAPARKYHAFDGLADPEVCDRPEFGGTREWTTKERNTAREWFRDHVGVYVLGLLSDVDRWRMIADRLESLRIWATHVPGVDPRDPGQLAEAKAAGWIPPEFNFTLAQEVAYRPEQNMGSILGTMGCASAHFKAQAKVMADGSPLALVFEDDSWPSDDFVERLWSLVTQELPCDWEVTALYTRCPYGKCVSPHLTRVQPDANEPAWRCRHGVNWGMQAVLYRTGSLAKVQETWKRVVFDEARPHCMDVDVALASVSDQVAFYAVPAVQDPGFLKETNHPSLRWSINMEARSTSTTPPPWQR